MIPGAEFNVVIMICSEVLLMVSPTVLIQLLCDHLQQTFCASNIKVV